MKIEFVVKPGAIAPLRQRPRDPHAEVTRPLYEVVQQLAEKMPGLLMADPGKKRKPEDDMKPSSVEVTLRYAGEDDDIVKLAVMVDPEDTPIRDVMVMPYDKVWRVIIEWFGRNPWVFPGESFRYDTGEHGMVGHGGMYDKW